MKVLKFDTITDDVILLAQKFTRSVTPSWQELAALQQVDSKSLRIIAIVEDNDCRALSCCFIEERQIAGMRIASYSAYGYDFFDYNCLFSEPSFISVLLEEIRKDAKAAGADHIRLKNIILDITEGVKRGVVHTHQTCIYDSSLEETGYQPLLRKKSLKRHVNKCKRSFSYSCEHFTGEEIPLAEVEQMGALHIETRQFHNTPSAFTKSSTVDRYMSHLGNRILTKISVDDEPLAYHYGIRFNDTMIWHTPVVNIKYYNYSPLEVLLFEMIAYCEKAEIPVIDLGIGDEVYKLRFSNSRREVHDLVLKLSPKGHLINILKSADARLGMRSRIQRFAPQSGSSKQKTHAGVLTSNNDDSAAPAAATGHKDTPLVVARDFEEFVDYCRQNGLGITHQDYDNLRSGMVFCKNEPQVEYGNGHAWKHVDDEKTSQPT